MKLIPALIPLALLLAACGEESRSAGAAEEPAAPVKGGSYQVQVTFTPGAEDKLRDLGEKVTIANIFYGQAGEAAAGGKGEVQLGMVMRDIAPQDQIVTIAEPALDAAELAKIGGEPMLRINIYSAQEKHPDNLLNCGAFSVELRTAEREPAKIECDLLNPEVIEHAPIVAPTDEN